MKKPKSVVASKFWELTITETAQGWFEASMPRPDNTTWRLNAYSRQNIIKAAKAVKTRYYYVPTKEVIQL